MGRQKLKISYVDNPTKRHAHFKKRFKSIFKKASELCILSGAKVSLSVEDTDHQKLYVYKNRDEVHSDHNNITTTTSVKVYDPAAHCFCDGVYSHHNNTTNSSSTITSVKVYDPSAHCFPEEVYSDHNNSSNINTINSVKGYDPAAHCFLDSDQHTTDQPLPTSTLSISQTQIPQTELQVYVPEAQLQVSADENIVADEDHYLDWNTSMLDSVLESCSS